MIVMKFGFFTTLSDPGNPRGFTRIVEDLREQVVLADQGGFDAVWLAEHHFGPEGMGNIPNPLMFALDLAHRTRRVRFGTCAVILPWWHPLRVAEDIATLDHMVGGRLDIAFGRGIWPREGPNFHPAANPKNSEVNLALFREGLEVVRKAWTEEFFSHKGEFYTFPAPETRWNHPMYPPDPRWRDGDVVTKLNVTPKPFQRPYPPLWQVCSSPSSIEFSAKNGLMPMLWQPPATGVRYFRDMYQRIRSEAEGKPFDMGGKLAVLRQIYVAPTMEQARAEGEKATAFVFLYNNPFRGLAMFMNPGEQPTPDMKMGFDFLQERGNTIVGSPDYVVERLQELREIGGCDYVMPDMAQPYLSQKQILASIELFATKVMPKLRS